MTDKELIKQEIERLYKHYLDAQEFDSGYNMALDAILQFIDSFPEEPFDYTNVNIIPKDFGELPQTIEQAAVQAHIELEECNGLSFVNTFFKGAEWQKQKSMQDFLEKAEEFFYEQFNIHPHDCHVVQYVSDTPLEDIDDFVEQFKNYMQNESEN